MVKVSGKNGITVTVIADSVNILGNRMTTLELEYPRFIHSEVMTHRMLSKNAASSRAIPIKTTIEHVKKFPATPVHWGKNQAGMQAKEELDAPSIARVEHLWHSAKESAIHYLEELQSAGLHKQIASRIIEPWFMMKTVISGTEWNNLIWLRDHEDAQPEFAELAKCIVDAVNKSTPILLHAGEWHLPYVTTAFSISEDGLDENIVYLDTDGNKIDLDTARKVSASCCAQVSYRKLDDSVEKAIDIFNKLFSGSRVHASPVEHQATPMIEEQGDPLDWEAGVTHVDRNGKYWSGNLCGWIQYRKLIANEAVW